MPDELNTMVSMEVQTASIMTVPIDATLSVEGEAADAKAVGNALADKANRSELQTAINVNGETADSQGTILVDASEIPMDETDAQSPSVKDEIDTLKGWTAEDIPTATGSGRSIGDMLTALAGMTAESLPMSGSDPTSVLTEIQALMEQTGASIPMTPADSRSISAVLSALISAAVTVQEQTWNSTQQGQARSNIGAARETRAVQILNGQNVTSDTYILDLPNGCYQVSSTTDVTAYLPNNYGTLLVMQTGGGAYGAFLFMGTNGSLWTRHRYSTGWHGSWKQLAFVNGITTGTVSKASDVSGTLDMNQCQCVGNVVNVGARIHSATQTANGTIFTIPEGFRPMTAARGIAYLKLSDGSDVNILTYIDTNGNVSINYSSSATATQIGFCATYGI